MLLELLERQLELLLELLVLLVDQRLQLVTLGDQVLDELGS